MQSPKKTLTALLATTALMAAPAAAVAQNAGDQQYADPLSDTPSQHDSGGGGNSGSQNSGSGNSGSQGNSGSGNAGTTQSQSTPATPSTQADTSQATGEALPRTGSDSALLLAAGAVLLGSGMLLRLGVTARRVS
jgi:LPXTG-motif cell wall-anchored protein